MWTLNQPSCEQLFMTFKKCNSKKCRPVPAETIILTILPIPAASFSGPPGSRMKRFRRHGQESQRDRLKQELFQFNKASELYLKKHNCFLMLAYFFLSCFSVIAATLCKALSFMYVCLHIACSQLHTYFGLLNKWVREYGYMSTFFPFWVRKKWEKNKLNINHSVHPMHPLSTHKRRVTHCH